MSTQRCGQPAGLTPVYTDAAPSARPWAGLVPELRLLNVNPLALVNWIAPKNTDEVDRRVVVNLGQAAALLAAVERLAPELVAFFGSMYYAALRPEEALHLREDEYERPRKPGGWGWLHLTGATIAVGTGWGDGETAVEDRQLKHRAKNATRDVPVAPELAALLDRHLRDFGTGTNGKLFVTRRGPGGRYVATAGQPIPNNTYTRVWRQARARTLTEAQQRSPLAKVPYHLRHAAVSLWLNAGVPATQVAEWAGHSVHVLMRVYAKCIYGQDEAARRRIEAALTADEPAADQPAVDQPSADQVTADTPLRDDGSEPGSPTRIRHDQSARAGRDGIQ